MGDENIKYLKKTISEFGIKTLLKPWITSLISLLGLNYEGRLGVIGSKSKWKAFVKAANSAGIENSSLESVRCPIGLNIGAETPEEIAVAVAAEIMGLYKQIQVTSPTWRQKE